MTWILSTRMWRYLCFPAALFGMCITLHHAYAGFTGNGVVDIVPITNGGLDKDALDIFDRNLKAWNDGGQTGTRPTYPPFEDVSQAHITTLQMYPPFQGKTNAQIIEKVQNVRRALVCAIELVGQEDRNKALGLQRLMRLQKICFALRRTPGNVGASIFPDGRADFGVEPINIFIPVMPQTLPTGETKPTLCDKADLTNFAVFDLYKALTHEALHGTQTILQPTGRPNFNGTVDLQCREVEAHEGDFKRVCDMLTVIESLKGTPPKLPDNVTGSVQTFGATILAAPNRAALVQQWEIFLKHDKEQERNFLNFRKLYKQAGEASLNGDLDANKLQRELRPYRPWVQVFGNNRDFYLINRAIFYGEAPQITGTPGSRSATGGGMKKIVPPSLEPEDVTVPGFDVISDCHINFAMNIICVAGVSYGETNLGKFGTFDLDPDTGDIIDGSFRVQFESELLNTGYDIITNEFEPTKGIYAVTLGTGDIFQLLDDSGDGIPDMPMHLGKLPLDGVNFIREAQFVDQHSIAGFPNPIGSVLDRDSLIGCAHRTEPGGLFENTELKRAGSYLAQHPNIGGLPFVGRPDLPVIGTPGRGFEVFFDPIAGGDPFLAGTGVFGSSGFGCPTLGHPIQSDYFIRVVDDTGASSPQILCAPTPGMIPLLKERMITGPNGPWSGIYNNYPGQPIDSQHSVDFSTWGTVEMSNSGAFGERYVSYTPGRTTPREFWRVLNQTETAPAENEDFTIQAGLELNLYLKGSLSTYASYELVEEPDLPESRFQWNKDGSYTVSLTTFGAPVTFTYRPVFANPLMPLAPTTTVVISGDNTLFTDPVPYPADADPEDQSVDVFVLNIGGEDYPAYQFFLANSPFDLCEEPHWHSSVDVFSFEQPTVGVPDPDPPECGFGVFPELAPELVTVSFDEWTAFTTLNP